MDTVKKGDVISIEYIVTNDQGLILDSSKEKVVHFLFGYGEMTPKLEKHIVGAKIDDLVKFKIGADENFFGVYNPQLIIQTSLDQFGEGEEISVGKMFEKEGHVFQVTKIENELVTLDANHPFIGQNLNWDVIVVASRPATEVELDLGRAHVKEESCGDGSCAIDSKKTSSCCSPEGGCC